MTRKILTNRRSLYLALSLLLVCLLPTPAAAWGNNGHRIIARIAMDRLSPGARQMISELLGQKETLESASTWADTIRPQRPDTTNWHFVDIALKSNNYLRSRDCGQGCVIEAINSQTAILKDAKRPAQNRAEALKFLIHLVGDLHHPFHVTTNTNPTDRGANLVTVVNSVTQRQTNLHAVWDEDIISYALGRQLPADYASQLSNRFRGSGVNQDANAPPGNSVSTQGSVTDWALEAHRLAGPAYIASNGDFMVAQKGRVFAIDDAYLKKNKTVVEVQLVRAGARLAKILNEMFSRESKTY